MKNLLLAGFLAVGLHAGCASKPGSAGMPATQAKFQQVQTGMTIAQVESLFGISGQVSKNASPNDVEYISWTNEDLTGCAVLFKDGRVTYKVATKDLK